MYEDMYLCIYITYYMMILTSKFTNGSLSKNQHPSSHGIRDDMCYII